jgi:hypothetical protein
MPIGKIQRVKFNFGRYFGSAFDERNSEKRDWQIAFIPVFLLYRKRDFFIPAHVNSDKTAQALNEIIK